MQELSALAPVRLLQEPQRPRDHLSGLIERAFELAIGEVAQLAGDDGPLVGDEEHLPGRMHVADLVGRH